MALSLIPYFLLLELLSRFQKQLCHLLPQKCDLNTWICFICLFLTLSSTITYPPILKSSGWNKATQNYPSLLSGQIHIAMGGLTRPTFCITFCSNIYCVRTLNYILIAIQGLFILMVTGMLSHLDFSELLSFTHIHALVAVTNTRAHSQRWLG